MKTKTLFALQTLHGKKNTEDPNGVIANWMRNRNTIEFLGMWEQLFNPYFNPLEFEGFRKEAGLNAIFIEQGIPQHERLIKLNQIAIHQMQVLEDTGGRKLLQ